MHVPGSVVPSSAVSVRLSVFDLVKVSMNAQELQEKQTSIKPKSSIFVFER